MLIIEYSSQYRQALLDLLLKLQDGYFKKVVSPQHAELGRAKDNHKAFSDYIDFLEQQPDWKVLLAFDKDKPTGMIIGSVTTDEDLALSVIGKIEDWYVEDKFRKKGVGGKLYDTLEKWFVERGCSQVLSDTWIENELSIATHKKLGFFVTGIQFGKRLR